MDYKVAREENYKLADISNAAKFTIKNKSDNNLSRLSKGQLISGTVLSVDEDVTLDIQGERITVSKDILKNAVRGEVKTFEVIKASGNEVELKLLDSLSEDNQNTLTATRVQEPDKDYILDRKDKNAKQAEREKAILDMKDKLEEIGIRLTEQDCMLLEKNGIMVDSLTVVGIMNALDKVKSESNSYELAAAGMQKSYGQTSSMEQEIEKRLKEANLPVTSENIQSIKMALEQSSVSANMDDKTMQYLIAQDLEPTIANIYKAYYSGSKDAKNTTNISDEAWKELSSQVQEVIREAGYPVNAENVETAKWLLSNNLPVTKESYAQKKALDEIKNNMNKDAVLDNIIDSMKQGIAPKNVSLYTSEYSALRDTVDQLQNISEEAISQAVREDSDITIKRLLAIQEGLSAKRSDASEEVETEEFSSTAGEAIQETAAAIDGRDYRFEEIKARRQLEEIRLKMTYEAAAQLEKKGFSIELKKLEEVVEALRELENNYYKELLQEQNVEVSEESVQILRDTTQSVQRLQWVPSYVLGSTLSQRKEQTIPSLLTDGNQLQAKLDRAGTAYDALMTVPNAEYGDSIQKAFRNMDGLLAELNIENTEQNQRAVRILGYNNMEINQQSVNQIKAYDMEVNRMMRNLHPQVTVSMIKEGLNPLDMPISELNQVIDRIREEQGITSEERYSNYLIKLEKSNEITPEERKSYIGIYRLLYNVEKTDGAALGAVINSGREVTLEHLLSAVRTGKKGRLDAIIDDEFGTLQSVSREGETITDQLSALQNKDEQNPSDDTRREAVAEQIEYMNQMLKDIAEQVSPGKLQSIQELLYQTEASGSEILPAQLQEPVEEGIWNSIKSIPIEKLWEQVKSVDSKDSTEYEAYTDTVNQIRTLCKNSEQAIRFLNDFQVPATPLHIVMANHILSSGESAITKLKKLEQENIDENLQNNLKETDDISDTLIDKSSMENAYAQLEANAKEVVERACSEEKIDSRRLAELKSIGQQITFLRKMASKEFYQIPIETEKGVTNMNLTIIRGARDTGKLSVTIRSEQLGNMKAEFSLKDQTLSGFISSDSREGLSRLQENISVLEHTAEESNIAIKQVNFGLQQKDNDSYRFQISDEDTNNTITADTERTLYRIAKSVVRMVHLSEQ